MNRIDELALMFRKFPGIGPRQSKRFVYFLLRQDDRYSKKLALLIEALQQDTGKCSKCMRFFTDPKKTGVCDICTNPSRDPGLLMIVERDVDLENVEKSGIYKGLYFILGGNIPLTESSSGTYIQEKELLDRIKTLATDGLEEVIVATNATTEGDHTREYLDKLLLTNSKKHKFKITHLGRGLSTGTELEYSDRDTLRDAFNNRN